MEIVLVEFPNSNHKEQSGFRPAIVFSNSVSTFPIVIPITSNMLALRFEYTQSIDPSIENGLTSKSVILFFQIRAIDKKRIVKSIGKISNQKSAIIKSEIKKLLELDK